MAQLYRLANAAATSGTIPAVTGVGTIPSGSSESTVGRILSVLEDVNLAHKRILDLGAGSGYLSWKLHDWLQERRMEPEAFTACDRYPDLHKFDKVECVKGDLTQELPFEDASFDLVVCMNAVEHVPNQLHLFGELGRIVRFGGRALVATPNVLNANARLRYLLDGTRQGFDILPLEGHDVRNPPAGIGPVSLYALYDYARLAGFSEVRFHADQPGRSATLLAPAVLALSKLADLIGRGRGSDLAHWPENKAAFAAANRRETLAGRTIIVEAIRSVAEKGIKAF